MTIYEAFQNRGLLVPERCKPIYRITYSDRCEKGTAMVRVNDIAEAKEQLGALWEQYAYENHITEDCVLDVQCVGNGDGREI